MLPEIVRYLSAPHAPNQLPERFITF
jgi:hypothetical protein